MQTLILLALALGDGGDCDALKARYGAEKEKPAII